MTNDHRKLVLVVDTDQRFIDDARPLLAAHRVVTARDLDEAREIVLGGRVDLVLLGPAFGSDVAVSQARSLLELGSALEMALVTDVVTNRLLRSALKCGLMDVVDTPLTDRDVADLVEQLASSPLVEIEFVVEAPATTAQPAGGESVVAPVSQVAASTLDVDPPAISDQTGGVSIEFSGSVSTPVDASFETAAVQHFPSEPPVAELPQTLAAATAAAVMPEAVEPPTPNGRHPEPSPVEPAEIPPASTPGDIEPPPISLTPPPVLQPVEQFAEPVAVGDGPSDDVFESQSESVPEPAQPPPPPTPIDVLDRVMATPPPIPAPPTVDHGSEPPPPVPTAGPGRVIAVMAGKGGSGKTITATNLAIAIGLRNDPERVAIVDADLQFGDVALVLKIDPVRTLDDVVGQIDQMSDERLDAALLRHESGVRVLPAPLLPVRAGEIDAKSVVEVIDRLRSIFATVIVDTGPVFDDALITLLEHADHVITVVDMDLPSVKNAKVALEGLRRTGFDMHRIRLVVNRANSKARLDLDELERSLDLRACGLIPSDRLIPQSVNEGIPVLALSPRSKVARAFNALAESFEPDSTPG